MGLALSSYKSLDRGLFEAVGPFGATRALMSLASSRVFGAFSLGTLSLFLATVTLVLTCFTWGAVPLAVLAGLVAGTIAASQNNNT